jgi:hypothetical protein
VAEFNPIMILMEFIVLHSALRVPVRHVFLALKAAIAGLDFSADVGLAWTMSKTTSRSWLKYYIDY